MIPDRLPDWLAPTYLLMHRLKRARGLDWDVAKRKCQTNLFAGTGPEPGRGERRPDMAREHAVSARGATASSMEWQRAHSK